MTIIYPLLWFGLEIEFRGEQDAARVAGVPVDVFAAAVEVLQADGDILERVPNQVGPQVCRVLAVGQPGQLLLLDDGPNTKRNVFHQRDVRSCLMH